jgi:hypothetical protein
MAGEAARRGTKEERQQQAEMDEKIKQIGTAKICMDKLKEMFMDEEFHEKWQNTDKEDYKALMELILGYVAPLDLMEPQEEKRIVTLN